MSQIASPTANLQEAIVRIYEAGAKCNEVPLAHATFERFREALTHGEIRAAEKRNGAWHVNTWVKQGILVGFRIGTLHEWKGGVLSFVDKSTYPPRRFEAQDKVRIVPGGSSVRMGAYVAPSVICMPPMFVNVGAYIDECSMIDSHALVGSCAQIGKRVHLSAGSQVGGVLEPVNAAPVIVEDDVLIGGNCGIYEGTLVHSRAVLGAGTILTRSTPVYDLVRGTVLRSSANHLVEIPEGAVVVPGSRAVTRGKGQEWGLSLYTPVIVKYRDDKTDQAIELEDLLR